MGCTIPSVGTITTPIAITIAIIRCITSRIVSIAIILLVLHHRLAIVVIVALIRCAVVGVRLLVRCWLVVIWIV